MPVIHTYRILHELSFNINFV